MNHNRKLFTLALAPAALGLILLAVSRPDSGPDFETPTAGLVDEVQSQLATSRGPYDEAPSWNAGGQRSVSDAPVAASAAARDCAAALHSAMASHNPKLGGDVVRSYFHAGPAAVQGLVDFTLSPDTGFADAPALGVLFKSATYYLQNEPELLHPWTLEDFATLGLDMLGQGDHVPVILCSGFDEIGEELGSGYLLGLLDAIENRDIGPIGESQYPAQVLAKNWAKTMGTEVVTALTDSMRSEDVTDYGRGQAANMLIARDWRQLGPELLTLRSELKDAGQEELNGFDHALSSGIMNTQAFDRADYYTAFSDDQDLAISMVWQMGADDAELALSQPASQDLAPIAHDLLSLRSSSGDPFDTGMRLLTNPDLSGSMGSVEQLVVGAWLASDMAYDPRVSAYLNERFEKRDKDPATFWRSISVRFSETADHHAMAAVLPLLERSKGEDNYARKKLLAMANARFEDLNLE